METDNVRIEAEDRRYLRELAKRLAEIGNLPIQRERVEKWTAHNDLEGDEPLVLVFPEGSWRELLPDSELVTTGELCRGYEMYLRQKIYYHEYLPDDNPIEPAVKTPIVMNNSGWGIELRRTDSRDALGAYHIEPAIIDEADADKLRSPRITVDWDATKKRQAVVEDLFGDILDVQLEGMCRGGICPVDLYAKFRGIDMMFMDLYDKPEFVHNVLSKLVDGHIQMIKDAEEQGALTLGNRTHYAGSGGNSYTKQLPQADFDGEHVRPIDMWGFSAAQIFSEVSPEMHEEFALRHENRYLEMFGLNCYGCCEPLHLKIDQIKRNIPRLRRISISPWANVDIASEKLGKDYIYSWKPNPADLAGETWEPETIRRRLREFRERTKGNIVEIIMKDTHTVRHDPKRMWDWVRIAKEVAREW